MYNAHRGMVPGAQPNRLQELLDQIRQEFENEAGRAGEMERQREFAPAPFCRCTCICRPEYPDASLRLWPDAVFGLQITNLPAA